MSPRILAFIVLLIVAMTTLHTWYNARQTRCGNNAHLTQRLYDEAEQIYGDLNNKWVAQEEMSPSPILPFMFVGDVRDARSVEKIQQLGITHILNCAHFPSSLYGDVFAPDIQVKRLNLPIVDNPFFDISQYFEQTHAFIDDARKSGGRVLVHCMAGVSRSATIAIYYVSQYMDVPMREAIKYTKTRRRKICPNIGFIQQLLASEFTRCN